jgi:hypothetical protein
MANATATAATSTKTVTQIVLLSSYSASNARRTCLTVTYAPHLFAEQYRGQTSHLAAWAVDDHAIIGNEHVVAVAAYNHRKLRTSSSSSAIKMSTLDVFIDRLHVSWKWEPSRLSAHRPFKGF